MKCIRLLSFVLSILFLVALLISKYYPSHDINSDYIVRGNFDAELAHLSNLTTLELYISKEAYRRNISILDTLNYLAVIDSVLQLRFYHGTARYNLSENWLASIMGNFLWDDLRMMVIPNQILTKNVAACNQINLVLHHLLKRANIDFRPVGLNNHMVTEVKYNGTWHMYDVDYEPKLDRQLSVNEVLNNEPKFKALYEKTNGKWFNNSFDKILATKHALYFDENVLIAKNLKAYQYFTGFLSSYGWLIFLFSGILIHLLRNVRTSRIY